MTPLEAALSYAARGWRVFPLKPGTKEPATIHGCLDATTDEARVYQWWGVGGSVDAGVGIATGRESGLWVVDVDDLDVWFEIEQKQPLPFNLVRSHTPSGGEHLYFAWPGGDLRNTASRVADGIDTRGEGGYVVAPGTPGYEWDLGASDEPPDPPAWLIEAARPPALELPTPARPVEPLEDAPPGVWLNHCFDWGTALREQGATFAGLSGAHSTWTRPGKDRGVSATLGYLSTGDGVPRLKVFTSNWPGLAAEQTYDPLGYVAATRFNGSLTDAVTWAGQQRRLVEGDKVQQSWERLLKQGSTITIQGPGAASIPESPKDDISGWEPIDWAEIFLTEQDWPAPLLLLMDEN